MNQFPKPNTRTATAARTPHSPRGLGLGLLWFCGMVGLSPLQAQPLLITEFMAANDTVWADEDGDFSDWIELFNAGNATVDLEGWYLTDDRLNRTKWRFPSLDLAPRSFLVVFASGKNRASPAGPLHTSFRLAAAGEYLGLVEPDGRTVASEFSPAFPAQHADLSFGLAMDGLILLSGGPLLLAPTPGDPNGPAGVSLAPSVRFSRPGGTFVNPFDLILSTSSTNAVIRYELVQTKEQASASLTNVPNTDSAAYTAPLHLARTTQVRARAFEAGKLPGPPVTITYLQISSEVAQFSSDLPVVLVHNFGAGVLPNQGNQGAVVASFESATGRRNSPVDSPALITRAGLTEKGSATAYQQKQGMNVEFWDEYNQDIDYEFLGMPMESDWVFHSLGGFDPSLMHNALFHELGRRTGRYSSRARYVEVFRKTDLGPVSASNYFGLFLVLERPRRGPDRVNIQQLGPGDVELPAVTGGYLLRLDRVDSNERAFLVPAITVTAPVPFRYGGQQIVLDDPKGLDLTTDPRRAPQLEYVKGYFTNFMRALTSDGFNQPVGGYRDYVDVDSWVDNHIVNTLCFNVDAYRLNSYLFKDRSSKLEQGPWWDCDRCLGTGGVNAPPTSGTPQMDNRAFNPRVWRQPTTDPGTDLGTDFFGRSLVGLNWWDRLFRDTDFWQRWIDRYQELRAGPLATEAVLGIVDNFHVALQEAQEREQARWSGVSNFPRWGRQIAAGYTNDFGPVNPAFPRGGYYASEVAFLKQWLRDRLEFMDTNFLARPVLSQDAGAVTPGTSLLVQAVAKPGTVIFYTLDGQDPRLPGGAVAPQALMSAGSFALTVSSTIRMFARCYNPNHSNLVTDGYGIPQVGNPPSNSFWSGAVVGTYYTTVPSLRLTEIHYHPSARAGGSYSASDFEFLELLNASPDTLNLAGMRFTSGVAFVFPPEFLLPSGAHAVVVKNRAAFASRYGTNLLVAGQFSGDLDDGGERLALVGRLDEPIFDLAYEPGWIPITAGHDFSLVPVDESSPSPVGADRSRWRASSAPGGSPGRTDPAPSEFVPVVVNEVSAHAAAQDDNAIELANLSLAAADVSGWFLTDDFADPGKFRIPAGTVLAPGGFVTFAQRVFNDPTQPASRPFALRPRGGEVYLFSADPAGTLTGYAHGFGFGPAAAGVTFGRHVTSTGEERFVAQVITTLGTSNAGPTVGPLILSEIHYQPIDPCGRAVESAVEEFVEVHNSSSETVALGSEAGTGSGAGSWRLQGDLGFSFPPGSRILPGRYAVVVAFDPQLQPERLLAWRSRFAVSEAVPVFGPWTGSLADSRGRIELAQLVQVDAPGLPLAGAVVDGIGYSSALPWPSGAAGTGLSLQRLAPPAFGDDPAQWRAGTPTPGRSFPAGPPPALTIHPTNTAVPRTGTALFFGAASGSGSIRYAWRFNGCLLPDATNRTLVLPNVQSAQAGAYELLAFDDFGVAVSRSALLTVLMPPNILQPPLSQKVGEGTDVTFAIGAVSSRPPLTYQWLHRGVPIPGATGATLFLPNVTGLDEGTYGVALTDGNGTAFSPTAVLTVLVPPSMVSPVPPLNLAVVEGGTLTLSARTRGSRPMLYRWRQIFPGGASVRTNFVLDANTGFYTIANLRTNDAGIYTLILTNEAAPLPNIQRTNAVVTVLPDVDRDGIPDNWEIEFFGSPTGAARDADPDGDSQSNWAEYAAGTDPTRAQSYLKVDRIAVGTAGTVRLEFLAVANRTYSIQYRDAIESLEWRRLADVVASAEDRVTEIFDPSPAPGSPQRFYRLVTPRAGE